MSNIIDFAERLASRSAAVRVPISTGDADARSCGVILREKRRQRWQEQPPATETARNARLREQRHDAWYAAEAKTRYWRVRMSLDSAISSVRRAGLPEAGLHPVPEDQGQEWMLLVQSYRNALAKQLLTPAAKQEHVTWKHRTLLGGDLKYTCVTTEMVEQVIAQDEAFLAAHPTRRSKATG